MNQIEIAIRDMVEALRTQQYDRAHMLVDSVHVLRDNGTPFPFVGACDSVSIQEQVQLANEIIAEIIDEERFDPEG